MHSAPGLFLAGRATSTMQSYTDSAQLHQGCKMRTIASKSFPGIVPSRLLVLLVIAISGASRSSAQVASRPAAQTITATSPATPDDPLGLGRETPRGTVIGFVGAAQSENYDVAVQYFDVRGRIGVEPDRKST